MSEQSRMSEQRRQRGIVGGLALAAGLVVLALLARWRDPLRHAWSALDAGEPEVAAASLEGAADGGVASYLRGRSDELRLRHVAAGRHYLAAEQAQSFADSARFHRARVRFAGLEVSVRALLASDPVGEGDDPDARRLHAQLGELRALLLPLLPARDFEPKLRRSLQVVGELRASLEQRFGLPPEDGSEEGQGLGDPDLVQEGDAEGQDAVDQPSDRPGVIPGIDRWGEGLAEAERRLEEVLERSRQREQDRGFPAPRPGEKGW